MTDGPRQAREGADRECRPRPVRALIFCLPALLAVASCSCRERPGGPEESKAEVLPLDRLPMEQLRQVLKGHIGDWRSDTDQSRGLPAPAALKTVPAGAMRIDLVDPGAVSVGTMSLADAIGRRRSHRTFSDEPLTLEEVSYLLWCAQGVTATVRDATGAAVQSFRTAPSGGARYPLESYLLAHRVKDLPPGMYRYLPVEHKLAVLGDPGSLAAAVQAACYGRPFVGQAAAVFVWTAVPYRTEWRYAYLAHRMIAMEAGHVCQNLYLGAESIGAGACAVLGYDQTSMDQLLGVDGRNEFTLYLACVGKTD
jgi:SagB-type dehydrogenase family enzyme